VAPTVAGGLTFHGAPLNNYMLHAACAMVRALRDAPGALGLLYGQGGFVTQHRTLVLGSGCGTGEALVTEDRQAEADRRRGPAPTIAEGRSGMATVETHTVAFRTDGTPDYGAVVLRLPDGARTMARVPREDASTLDALMSPRHSAIGMTGQLIEGREGLQEWRAG
jgi:acetyl-CoA C-acetyltransferase